MKYIALLLVILFLAGCASTQQPTGQKTTEQVDETTPATEVDEGVAQQQPVNLIPADIQSLFDKGKTKLVSYSYTYFSPNNGPIYKIWVKGTKMKKELPQFLVDENKNPYDTIYLDTAEKSAKGYCIEEDDCKDATAVVDLVFDEEYIPTPVDWIDKITNATKIDEITVENRPSTRIKTNIGEVTIEKYYGWIFKIDDGKKVWRFTAFAPDRVTDEEVTPPVKE